MGILSYTVLEWEKTVYPHTPLEDFCDSIMPISTLMPVASLICGMSMSLTELDQDAANFILDRLVNLWPSIWKWMQNLHVNSLRARFRGARQSMESLMEENIIIQQHTMLCHALHGFTTHGPPYHLAALVKRTEGVSEMMATLWLEEATSAVMLGFKAAQLLLPNCTVPFDEIAFDLEVLGHIMDNNKHDPYASLRLLFTRIKRNLQQERPDAINLSKDFLALRMHITHPSGSKTLKSEILSHPTVTTCTLMDLLSLIAAAKSKVPTPSQFRALFCIPLDLIVVVCHQSRAYSVVKQLAGSTFLTMLADVALDCAREPLKDVDDGINEKSFKILAIISKFADYRSVLTVIQRNFSTLNKKYPKIPGPLGKYLTEIQSYFKSATELFMAGPAFEDAVDALLYVTVAGNAKSYIGEVGTNHYVSICGHPGLATRQVKHLSYDIQRLTVSLGSVRLSGPDLRFILHNIVVDFVGQERSQMEALGRDTFLGWWPFDRHTVRRLLLVLDYQAQNESLTKATTLSFDDPTAIRNLENRLPQLGHVWQSAWRTKKVSQTPNLQDMPPIGFPTLVILPRGMTDSQTMTVLLNSHQEDVEGVQGVRVRLLHYK
ncbi:hypothetical protein HWV62_41424 [Athelia sp. TMB]|nr:hypothetical protein HWV62_41424 [Athelia sp. TMB]